MSTHSILSPSGAERWAQCPGSLAACKDIVEDRGNNRAAALGSAKHTLTEWGARHNKTAAESAFAAKFTIHADGADFQVDEEFITHVQFALDAVNALPGQKMYEVRLDTSEVLGVEGQGGTGDVVALDYENATLIIADHKFGWGKVRAFKNKQLMIYLCAARKRFGDLFTFEKFKLVVIQPPLFAVEGLDHEYTNIDLDHFEAEIRQKAVLAYELYQLNDAGMTQANLSPSDKACEWCPIAGKCTARTKKVTDLFADVSKLAVAPATLDDEALGKLMILVEETFKPFMSEVMSEGYKRLLNGADPKTMGWGMYTGRDGHRRFNEAMRDQIALTLELTLGDDMYEERQLKSPTQIEAALKAAKAPALYATVAKYVERPPGKPSMQRYRTDVPAVVSAPQPEFADITAAATV